MTSRLLLLFLGLALSAFGQTHPVEVRSILVCGGSKVHLVDPAKFQGKTPHINWTWNAKQVEDLSDDYLNRFFNSVDDVKSVRNGRQMLISSSSCGLVL